MNNKRQLGTIIMKNLFKRRPRIPGIWANGVKESFNENSIWVEFVGFTIYKTIEFGRN